MRCAHVSGECSTPCLLKLSWLGDEPSTEARGMPTNLTRGFTVREQAARAENTMSALLLLAS